MPKRNNPFGDHSTLQLKTHVGTKAVDKGVNQVTRMQSVYDKTHELLFSGMKGFMNQSEPNNNNNNCIGIDHNAMPMALKSDNLKQMQLGNSCQLISNDVEMESGETFDVLKGLQAGGQAICGFDYQYQSGNSHSDFNFGRTPCEHSPPGFVSATSLMTTAQHSSAHVTGNNIFEKMKNAQMKMSSKSKSVGGACHSCTRPVLSREVLKCQFCENYVCSPCTRQCSGCFQHFCQLCSVLNYSHDRERAFCFSCSER